MTSREWFLKLPKWYVDRMTLRESLGFTFDYSENGGEKSITVRYGDKELGTVTGILRGYVAAYALAIADLAEVE